MLNDPAAATNVLQFEEVAREKLKPEAYGFLSGGADDMKTLHANNQVFEDWQIRARRLVDVSNVNTTIQLLGQELPIPILLAPIGFQRAFDSEGELAVVRAAARRHVLIASTLSSFAIDKITAASGAHVWFQLYPTPDRKFTRGLITRAEDAGCEVVVLTTDLPAIGNRENHVDYIEGLVAAGEVEAANFAGLAFPGQLQDPGLDWRMIDWLRANTRMQIVLKGIVTHEDATLSLENGVDGIIISNHGGRQEESNRSALECLPEVVEAVGGQIPVLIDGGFRRGTDIFKALALGADAVCIGRPYVWGLASFGQAGVERVLEIFRTELVRIMQLAGAPSLRDITSAFVTFKGR
jgi:isopentenyl diphosphate isomerase/L-lactate dehydrogenase-like FMN-dependent dehydrogenase